VTGDRVVRRSAAAALLVLLCAVSACSGGGGEAEQKSDPDDSSDDDGDSGGGAPGEDSDGSDSDSDDEGAPGEDTGDGDDGSGADAGSETDAQAAYVAYQGMFERLVITPNSDDPEIEVLTSGQELNHVVDTLTEFESRNQAVEFGTRHKHNVYDVEVNADGTVTVLDCFVSEARVVNASTRRILSSDPEGGAANVVTATLVRDDDDSWRVDSTSAVPVQPNQGCGPDGPTRRGT
jgi:hypothetical protein